ncbi:MAG: hypothetical protein ACFFBD_13635, partial [Candidatus Hodarchaeota archaeon]
FGREKSIEGSIAVLVFSIIGSLLFLGLLGILGGPFGAVNGVLHHPVVNIVMVIAVIIIVSFVAMIAEALSPADLDNLIVPASTLITLVIFDILLPAQFIFIRLLMGI